MIDTNWLYTNLTVFFADLLQMKKKIRNKIIEEETTLQLEAFIDTYLYSIYILRVQEVVTQFI